VATPSNASPTPADGTPSDAKLPPQADAAAVLAQAWADEDAAWRALAALWPLTLAPGDACRAAPSAGAACYRANGGLVTARLLGRPGLLPLRDAAGTGGWVLLTGLSDTEATLQTRQAEVRLPLALLAPLWRGDFATLWRLPPAADPGAIAAAGPGAFAVRAAAPAWLTARLDAAGVAAVPLGPGTRAGPALDERVRRFQIAQGLPPDGRAGPMTLMRLQLVAGDDEPRLRLR
jgi:general secretion pathway protein A